MTAVVGFSLDKQMTVEYVQRWTVDPQETLRRFTNEGMRGNYWEMLTRNPIGVGLGQGNGYAVFETFATCATNRLPEERMSMTTVSVLQFMKVVCLDY